MCCNFHAELKYEPANFSTMSSRIQVNVVCDPSVAVKYWLVHIYVSLSKQNKLTEYTHICM